MGSQCAAKRRQQAAVLAKAVKLIALQLSRVVGNKSDFLLQLCCSSVNKHKSWRSSYRSLLPWQSRRHKRRGRRYGQCCTLPLLRLTSRAKRPRSGVSPRRGALHAVLPSCYCCCSNINRHHQTFFVVS